MTLRLRIAAVLGPRDRRALRLGGGCIALALAGSLVVRPYLNKLLDARAALRTERELLARETGAILSLSRDRTALHARALLLSTTAPRLFSGSDAVTASAELARFVTRSAAESGLRVEQAETQTGIASVAVMRPAHDSVGATDETARELRVSLRARGNIIAIYRFLRAIESGVKLTRIDRIELVRAADEDAFDGTLTLAVVVAGRARRGTVSEQLLEAEEGR